MSVEVVDTRVLGESGESVCSGDMMFIGSVAYWLFGREYEFIKTDYFANIYLLLPLT